MSEFDIGAIVSAVWAAVVALWQPFAAEPRWLMVAGLVLDAPGAILIAWTAWFRVQASLNPAAIQMGAGAIASEPEQGLKIRRRMVYLGGALLFIGFALQIIATVLQIGAGAPVDVR